ncbi:MAG: hypothetical protein D3918_14035, partial [Candidatus Electrothrix sp. AX2]|nr:hypothetical protein [Candidatus Electrothrix gigas]
KELGIKIRSFDYLTDRLRKRVFLDDVLLLNGDWDEKHPRERNMLANPFYKSFGDSEWKQLLAEPEVKRPHFTSRSCNVLLRQMKKDSKHLKSGKKIHNKAVNADAFFVCCAHYKCAGYGWS